MSTALDRFFAHYYERRPVSATFTGIHAHDTHLPDWSPAGLEALDKEMHAIAEELTLAHPEPAAPEMFAKDAEALDAELARAFLAIQIAENGSAHGPCGNPALWTGEAVFALVSVMIREFAALNERVVTATARLRVVPAFLAQAERTLGNTAIPAAWSARALRECEGAAILLERGIHAWLHSGSHSAPLAAQLRLAAGRADEAFAKFAKWLKTRPTAPPSAMACGAEMYDWLLSKGHYCSRARENLLDDARSRLIRARQQLEENARATAGSWSKAQQQLAMQHPAATDYLSAFARTWEACRQVAVDANVVTWPEWPIRYVPFPEFTRDAAPYLYYLNYRSPAPFDPPHRHDYVVAPLPITSQAIEQHLRNWNDSVIKLNHVIHHGAVGHHVQNWHAYHRATSRIGQVAAVDCANRIGMFGGGTMAEGWACYATDLMEELGFLSPLEQLAQQHSRVRMLARAVVDIELHQGTMSFDDAVAFYVAQVGMSAEAARAETVKNSMFPCTAITYSLGTQGIHDLREQLTRRRGAAFNLKQFHDALLGHGSIPVLLVKELMLDGPS